LIDDALAVWANDQTITADIRLNLARRAITNASSRWPVVQLFVLDLAYSSIKLATNALGQLIAACQSEPCFFSLKVEVSHLWVRASSSALRAFSRALITVRYI
jgi:hypothetical protein